ncbi:MAG: MoaD/ThiS family protein [Desulfobulbaceae bacterium]|nr:MAG: MoaD/ThiS family protein [Desulfobulbaceae bacterium]
MKLTVKLFAYFRDDRFVAEVLDLPPDTSIQDIAVKLDIDPDEVGILMINSRQSNLQAKPSEGDTVAIFPKVGGG